MYLSNLSLNFEKKIIMNKDTLTITKKNDYYKVVRGFDIVHYKIGMFTLVVFVFAIGTLCLLNLVDLL